MVMARLQNSSGHPTDDLQHYVDRDKILPESTEPKYPFEKHDNATIHTYQKWHHADGRYQQAQPLNKTEIRKYLALDKKFEKTHTKSSWVGENDGAKGVNYLRLMKSMGKANDSNYYQWQVDGKTDKEIYDLFYKRFG